MRRLCTFLGSATVLVVMVSGCAPVKDPQVEKARENSEKAGNDVKQEVKQQTKEVKRDARDFGKKAGEEARKLNEETRPARKQLGENARIAAEQLKQGTKQLGQQAIAVAEGIREGWKDGDPQIDLNSASRAELLRIDGLSDQDARRIIAHRPYQKKRDLVDRKVISAGSYVNIEDKVAVR